MTNVNEADLNIPNQPTYNWIIKIGYLIPISCPSFKTLNMRNALEIKFCKTKNRNKKKEIREVWLIEYSQILNQLELHNATRKNNDNASFQERYVNLQHFVRHTISSLALPWWDLVRKILLTSSFFVYFHQSVYFQTWLAS